MRKAVFTIFALWLFTLLSLFCIGLGFRTFIEARKTKLFINASRATALAVSGLTIAEEILTQDSSDIDHRGESWAEPIELQETYLTPKAKATLYVVIEDESSRININKVNEPLLKKLFEQEVSDQPEEKADYLLDYIDSDSNSRLPESETKAKNQQLNAVEELLLVENMSAVDYTKLEPLITVFGSDAKVNLNTASREVLDLLLDDNNIKDTIFSVRFGLEEDNASGYYDTQQWQEFLNSLSSQLRSELETLFKLNSDIFRITSQAAVGNTVKKITCIFDRNSGKILYWDED
jgi:type II secretory pathway component PulK